MDPLYNPYTPNAGALPPVVAGREQQMKSFEVLLARLSRGRTEKSMVITGLRGVGKTVLLGTFREKALGRNWVVVELEAAKNDENSFRKELFYKLRSALFELSPRTRWKEKAKRAASILKSFSLTVDPSGALAANFDVAAMEGLADTQILSQDITEVFVALGEAAKEEGRGVLLLIDEMQFLNRQQMESIITALHKTVQRSLPITVTAAALPQIRERLGDAKSYAERLFRFVEIGGLSPSDARSALVEPAREENADFEDAALQAAIDITGGYPYFLQEIGHALWDTAETSPFRKSDVMSARELYENRLDESFFRVRLDRCSDSERAYLRAMAELGPQPHKAAKVAELLGRESTQVATVRSRLVEMGLIYTPKHGEAAFTVPQFDSFMLRTEPQLLPMPEKRKRKKG